MRSLEMMMTCYMKDVEKRRMRERKTSIVTEDVFGMKKGDGNHE